MDNERPRADEDATYFVMECDGISPAAMVRRETKWPGLPWMTGALITREVPNPVVFRTDPSYPGELLAMYDDTIPIMRNDLLEALRECGVDNLQIFPALVRDLEGRSRTDYKAVNIVGLVSSADPERSTKMDTATDFLGSDFAGLVLDEKRAAGALLFRLAEAPNAIVAHRRVRNRVMATVPGMTFYGPGDWAG